MGFFFAEGNVGTVEMALLLMMQFRLTQSGGHNWKHVVCINYAATKLISKSFISIYRLA